MGCSSNVRKNTGSYGNNTGKSKKYTYKCRLNGRRRLLLLFGEETVQSFVETWKQVAISVEA